MSNFVTQAKLAETYGLHINTIRNRVGELREQQGKRYTKPVVIVDGKIILVDERAFLDWLNVRSKIKRKIKVEPYDPRNYGETTVELVKPKEVNTDEIVQAVIARMSSMLKQG